MRELTPIVASWSDNAVTYTPDNGETCVRWQEHGEPGKTYYSRSVHKKYSGRLRRAPFVLFDADGKEYGFSFSGPQFVKMTPQEFAALRRMLD